MSLSTLRLAAGFMHSSQLGVDLVSRNIAGSEEPGYTRQTLATSSLYVDFNGKQAYEAGLGVRVDGFERVRDGFLDAGFRSSLSDAKAGQIGEELLGRLEGALSAVDLAGTTDDLRTALSQAAEAPEEPGVLQDALAKLEATTGSIRTVAGEIAAATTEVEQRQGDAVDRANGILKELADLNVDLPLGGNSGGQNALRDQRDKLLDELSGLMEVRVKIDAQDRAAVYLDGREILYNNRRDQLGLDAQGNLTGQNGQVLRPRSGQLEGLRELRQDLLPGLKSDLDNLATTLRDQLNGAHRGGFGSDGVSGRDILKGTDAASLQLAITSSTQLAVSNARMESVAPLGTGPLKADQAMASQPFVTAPSASGVININGHDVAWDSSQSLQTLADNLRGAGVEATWNPLSSRILLKRLPDGQAPADISVSDTSGNLSAVLGLTGPSYPGFDGDTLQAMSDLLGEDRFSGDTLAGSADKLLISVGSNLSAARDAGAQADRLNQAALERRQQVSGVSVDEELINLTRYEQAYAAAARLVNVADEMLSTVINMGAR